MPHNKKNVDFYNDLNANVDIIKENISKVEDKIIQAKERKNVTALTINRDNYREVLNNFDKMLKKISLVVHHSNTTFADNYLLKALAKDFFETIIKVLLKDEGQTNFLRVKEITGKKEFYDFFKELDDNWNYYKDIVDSKVIQTFNELYNNSESLWINNPSEFLNYTRSVIEKTVDELIGELKKVYINHVKVVFHGIESNLILYDVIDNLKTLEIKIPVYDIINSVDELNITKKELDVSIFLGLEERTQGVKYHILAEKNNDVLENVIVKNIPVKSEFSIFLNKEYFSEKINPVLKKGILHIYLYKK